MENNKISVEKHDFPKVWMKCLEIARFQDFAPNTPELLGALSGPQTPCRKSYVRESTNPPLEIPAYGPETVDSICIEINSLTLTFDHITWSEIRFFSIYCVKRISLKENTIVIR